MVGEEESQETKLEKIKASKVNIEKILMNALSLCVSKNGLKEAGKLADIAKGLAIESEIKIDDHVVYKQVMDSVTFGNTLNETQINDTIGLRKQQEEEEKKQEEEKKLQHARDMMYKFNENNKEALAKIDKAAVDMMNAKTPDEKNKAADAALEAGREVDGDLKTVGENLEMNRAARSKLQEKFNNTNNEVEKKKIGGEIGRFNKIIRDLEISRTAKDDSTQDQDVKRRKVESAIKDYDTKQEDLAQEMKKDAALKELKENTSVRKAINTAKHKVNSKVNLSSLEEDVDDKKILVAKIKEAQKKVTDTLTQEETKDNNKSESTKVLSQKAKETQQKVTDTSSTQEETKDNNKSKSRRNGAGIIKPVQGSEATSSKKPTNTPASQNETDKDKGPNSRK